MLTPPVDTSMTGYVSGSLDKQDDTYRNRQRPQPTPLVQNESGYGSAIKSRSSILQTQSAKSLLTLANAVTSSELLNNESNFASTTAVECYESDGCSIKRQYLSDEGLNECLCRTSTDSDGQHKHRSLIFFTTLESAQDATYKARSSLSKVGVEALMSCWGLNDLFVPDLLGRPNYWSPELYGSLDKGEASGTVEFFCQYPRFVIHGPGFVQRFPASVYMRYDAARRLTYYVVSAPESEDCVKNFKSLLNMFAEDNGNTVGTTLSQHPMEAHVILSKIFCESSQGYIGHFRQSMFAQLRAVDELSAQETADRKGLANVTIELQIISKDVNKLISDVDVASRNLVKMEEAFDRLNQACGPIDTKAHTADCQQLADTLQYLISSMDKQRMWLHNYRDRKDIAMNLVFNLVTQQDAANNITIAKDMRKDSSSMNGIALLTMVFLPGTFTSYVSSKTILGAGLYSATAQQRSIHVSGMWWFWAAITFPLTGIVLLLWGIFCWRQEFQRKWEGLMARKRRTRNIGDVEAKG